MYNLTNLTSAGSFGKVASFGNEITSGLLTTLLVFAPVLVIIIAMTRKGFDFVDVVLVSSFAGFVLSGLFFIGNLCSGTQPIIYLVILALAALFKTTVS